MTNSPLGLQNNTMHNAAGRKNQKVSMDRAGCISVEKHHEGTVGAKNYGIWSLRRKNERSPAGGRKREKDLGGCGWCRG